MNPKFGQVIRLGVRKDLTPIINDPDCTIISTMHNVLIKAVNGIDDDIVNQIKIMAIQKGIDTVYLLDKKNIISALEKQIPKKPIKIGEEYISERREWVYDYECPSCGNPYADDSYCSCCGQKLDWGSDTNDR
jgi:hypothetical protein